MTKTIRAQTQITAIDRDTGSNSVLSLVTVLPQLMLMSIEVEPVYS